MELTTTTKCDVRAFATLNPDGSLALKLTAHADYADGMTTSAEIATADVPAEIALALREQLAALVKSQEHKLGVLLQHAMHESRRVGRVRGELDANFAPIAATPDRSQPEASNA